MLMSKMRNKVRIDEARRLVSKMVCMLLRRNKEIGNSDKVFRKILAHITPTL